MNKSDVLRRLDTIKDMLDQEIAINAKWIREIAESAYSHLKQRYPKTARKFAKEGDES